MPRTPRNDELRALVRERWGKDSVSAIARDAGRSRARIQQLAKEMGLPLGTPPTTRATPRRKGTP